MMMPVIPGLIWLMAAACLLLLFLVIIGYHAYQRSRLAALAADAGDAGRLAARKEQLEADIAAMRAWMAEQQEQLQKFDADRRSQELLRIELAQLERAIDTRRKESEAGLKLAASLEASLVKKRNLIGALETEIRELEKAKAELEPMARSLADVRKELEHGKIRLAAQAEQEIKTAALQRQAEELASGLSELKVVIEPLQAEKDRLRTWLDQARNAVAIRSERVREQNTILRELESACQELKNRKSALEEKISELNRSHEQQQKRLYAEAAESDLADMRQKKTELQADLERLAAEIQSGQATLLLLHKQAETTHRPGQKRAASGKTDRIIRAARPQSGGRGRPASRHLHSRVIYRGNADF